MRPDLPTEIRSNIEFIPGLDRLPPSLKQAMELGLLLKKPAYQFKEIFAAFHEATLTQDKELQDLIRKIASITETFSNDEDKLKCWSDLETRRIAGCFPNFSDEITDKICRESDYFPRTNFLAQAYELFLTNLKIARRSQAAPVTSFTNLALTKRKATPCILL